MPSRLAAAVIVASMLGWTSPAHGQQDLSRDEAEQRLAHVQQEIARLREQLAEVRSEYQREQEELRGLDLEIDGTSRQARELEQQQVAHRAELDRLEAEKSRQLDRLATKRDQLADVMRSAYRLDRHSRLKLVLNQDDPAQLNRMLAYYEYFNRQHIDNISLLRDSLEAVEHMQRQIAQQLAHLEVTARQLSEALRRLDAQRRGRVEIMVKLDERIGSEQARLKELEQNRSDLVRLLERLEDALADIPADLGARLGVAQQKGRLPMPLPGKVQHAFGQRRGGALHWQGWLIGAEAGTEVRSVAYGRVAFADWLRGYGLILIIDHGGGFLSLYGNNESLLVEVGDWVEPGGLIAVVGSNPGMNQGLYFELRKDGKAVDPAAWIKR